MVELRGEPRGEAPVRADEDEVVEVRAELVELRSHLAEVFVRGGVG